jgi:hypothetical protein
MRFPLIILTVIFLIGCAARQQVALVYPSDREGAIVAAGTMLGRMDYAPRLEETNGRPVVRSVFAELHFTEISSNATAVRIESGRAAVLGTLLLKSGPLEGMPLVSGGKNHLALFGLHLLSPGISGIYSAYRNPFAEEASLWGRFFGHLGIDGALVVLVGSRAFSRSLEFDGAVLGALLLHRMVTIPGLMIETDLGNRALRAGYGLRF